MGDTMIKVEGLGKKYVITHERNEHYTALRDVISNKFKGLIKAKKPAFIAKEDFWALKDIDFEIKKGDAVGIIGRNGAGKSTLLKILSRITEPTHGRIELNGRVASLLEVGTGFHPELTGRENIFLNGAILGMDRPEIKRKFDEIVDFSGVERFLDTPVKRYSSGMYVRLAFAVAAHLEPEILVVDEVLAVGDAEFQKKCLGKMNDVSANEGRTVVFVSHDLNAITQLCKKTILLEGGRVALFDTTERSITKYLSNQKNKYGFIENREKDKAIYFRKIELVDEENQPKSQYYYSEPIIINFEIVINEENPKANVLLIILDEKKRRLFACESEAVSRNLKLQIEPNLLVRGDYSIHAMINIPTVNYIDDAEDVCNFTVVDNGSLMAKHGGWNYGSVFGRYVWQQL
jgi:lipopolysaccharide transport system ATP-binding protein